MVTPARTLPCKRPSFEQGPIAKRRRAHTAHACTHVGRHRTPSTPGTPQLAKRRQPLPAVPPSPSAAAAGHGGGPGVATTRPIFMGPQGQHGTNLKDVSSQRFRFSRRVGEQTHRGQALKSARMWLPPPGCIWIYLVNSTARAHTHMCRAVACLFFIFAIVCRDAKDTALRVR